MGTIGNDGGTFQRLQYTGARVDTVYMHACMKEEEKNGGEERERSVRRRWEIDLKI